MSSIRMSDGIETATIEDFVNESLRSYVLHVHLARGQEGHGYRELEAVLLMPSRFDAVVDEGHQACCRDSTAVVGSETQVKAKL